ncbi:P1 family peptidase [Nisaea acidiphila]|uniref:P1 family peptidase n=1 Tax=Nisaea acidiphila TaxID=1862145 RepID=A0A9J7AXJ6_9PROT|nr:P1 family peptidase [Nisaea acidiphila]UUX50141.1 P1 family peptidase [Nisaea acidiphila]
MEPRPGDRNLITDVPGLRVGNAHDVGVRTGVTVLLPTDGAMVASVDARGGGTGSREFDLLRPEATVERVNAIVLSGGSAYGLDAAGGVMSGLRTRGIGYQAGASIVPIVPSAILFDLNNEGDKAWGETSPYPALGLAALGDVGERFGLGNAGAGYGAQASGLKGGLGSASIRLQDGTMVGALVAVNAVGAAAHPVSGAFFSWDLEIDGEFGGIVPVAEDRNPAVELPKLAGRGENTTIAIVATDAALSKAQCRQFAIMAQQGLTHAIRPAHTPFDGDTVFGVSTGQRPLADPASDLARLGGYAANCLARAIARGLYEAESLGNAESYRERFGVS